MFENVFHFFPPYGIFNLMPVMLRTPEELNALDPEALKSLVLVQQSELTSQLTEIENLKLLVFKLKRMQFGRSSEKLDRQIDQLELRLEDLEITEAATEPTPVDPTPATSNTAARQQRRKPARRPLPASLPRETVTLTPEHESCPDCGGKLRGLGEDISEMLEYVPAHWKSDSDGSPKAELCLL